MFQMSYLKTFRLSINKFLLTINDRKTSAAVVAKTRDVSGLSAVFFLLNYTLSAGPIMAYKQVSSS